MSTHQVSKPRAAKKSMAENSGRPGTCRSKVGCEAIEEPCTNRIVPWVLAGSPAYFSHRKSRTSLPLLVQCSSPRMVSLGMIGLFIVCSDGYGCVVSLPVRRNTLQDLASISTATSAPTSKRSSGWVCTRNTWPDGSAA